MTGLTILVREPLSETKRFETDERVPPSRVLSRDRPYQCLSSSPSLAGLGDVSWLFTGSNGSKPLTVLEWT